MKSILGLNPFFFSLHVNFKWGSFERKRPFLEFTRLDLRRHLLLLVGQLHAGALPGGEVLGGRDHLAIFKLQVLHQQLRREPRGGELHDHFLRLDTSMSR